MTSDNTPMSRFTTVVFWFVAINALAGAGSLILSPQRTDQLFFWTITPALNAALFGALYLGGSLAVGVVTLRGQWEPARFLVPVLVAAGVLISLVTWLHIAQFTPGLRLFYWLVVYVGAPLLAIAIYMQQERGGANWSISTPLAPAARWLAVGAGAALLVAGLLVLAWPAPVAALWPWPMSMLMLRIFAAWFSAFGVGLLWFHIERDWGRLHLLAKLLIGSAAFDLLMLVLHRDDLTATDARLWLYCAHLTGLALLGGLLHWLQSRYARQRTWHRQIAPRAPAVHEG